MIKTEKSVKLRFTQFESFENMRRLPIAELLWVFCTMNVFLASRVLAQSVDCAAGCDSSKCQCSKIDSTQILVTCEGLTTGFFDCLNPDVIEFQLHRSSLVSLTSAVVHAGENLEILDISGNANFSTIEKDSLLSLTKLRHVYLDHNALTGLEQSIFPTSIEEIRLSNNKLTTIKYDVVFGGLQSTLTHLRLNHNELKDFKCPPLEQLKVLELHGNQLKSIDDEDFHDCHGIEELNLAGNLINEVKLNWTLIRNISFLDFSFNEIEEIGEGFHTALTKLKYLRAARNMMKNVPRFPIGLVGLDLNGNQFEAIKRDAFKDLAELTFLDISDQPHLVDMEQGAFAGLVSLFSLVIQNNRVLRYLPVDPWPDSKELREIHMSYNGIRIFRRELFEKLDDLWIAVVAGNPIECNCENAWIREEMNSRDNKWIRPWINGSEAAICYLPENMKDFYISELNADDLTCEAAILEKHSITKIANGVVLEALLSRGVPSTSWYLPDGRHIFSHRTKKATSEIGLPIEPLVEEHVLDNFTVIARLTAFTSNQPPYAIEYGAYILEYVNAGGLQKFTFDVAPQTSSPPSGGGSSGGKVAIVVILSLVMVVLLAVGVYFAYRYVNSRRQSRYQDINEEPDVMSSSESHVQELPEATAPFRAGPLGYGSTS